MSELPRRDPLWPRWLLVVLAAYALLAGVYSLSTPIFEPPDEVTHFPLIDFIADEGRLPEQDPDRVTPWQQEGSQPPLYYVLSTPLVIPIERSDLALRQIRNPHAKIGIGLASDNHVSVLHDFDAETFPWHDTALAVHVVRFFSIALSLGTIIALYHVARLAVPGRRALHITAVLLAAFNPMFLFISASVNNDNLINLLSAATLAVVLWIWRKGLTPPRLWGLALLLALAAISKLSGLALYPVAGIAVLAAHRRDRRPWRELVLAGLIVALVWAVVAGWWYWRNWRLYDDPTGTNVMVEIIGPRAETPSLAKLADEFEGFRKSFWGVFGTLNVIAPDWVFWYGDALSGLALLGLLVYVGRAGWRLRQFGHDRDAQGHLLAEIMPLLILAAHVGVIGLALVNWTRRTPATQGRLLFPALGPLTVLAVVGLAALLDLAREHLPRRVAGTSVMRALPLASLPLMVAAASLPFTTIRPTYEPPPTVDALPPGAIPVEAVFGSIELRGVRVDNAPVDPGEALSVTVYWHPAARTTRDMSLYIQVFGQDDPQAESGWQEIGKIDTYPGGGLLRTTTWEPLRTYADTYRIPIDPDARGPVRPRIKIGWRHFYTGEEFEPLALDGTPRAPVIIEAGRITGPEQHLTGGDSLDDVRFGYGGNIQLVAAQVEPGDIAPGDSLTVALEWRVRAPLGEDYQILVHLVGPDAPGTALANGDHAPLNGRWPTGAWLAGTSLVDRHTLTIPPDVPPGTYHLAVGFYRLDTFARLPATCGPQATCTPDTALLSAVISLEER